MAETNPFIKSIVSIQSNAFIIFILKPSEQSIVIKMHANVNVVLFHSKRENGEFAT